MSNLRVRAFRIGGEGMNRLRERLRWKVAAAVDHLPGMCWSNLVSFALRYRRSPIQRQDDMCRRDLARNGTCYCGKLGDRTVPSGQEIGGSQ